MRSRRRESCPTSVFATSSCWASPSSFDGQLGSQFTNLVVVVMEVVSDPLQDITGVVQANLDRPGILSLETDLRLPQLLLALLESGLRLGQLVRYLVVGRLVPSGGEGLCLPLLQRSGLVEGGLGAGIIEPKIL